jgi:hypothetical protein
MATELTYYIYEGILTGFVGGVFIHVLALSGGGGGSTKTASTFVSNNPYATSVKTTGKGAAHEHGGPIPLGDYKIHVPAQHPHLGRSCFLEPTRNTWLHGRRGFFIHGRGKHGSDGCIVPLEQFPLLMDRIAKDGGGMLHVLETLGSERFA